MTYKIIKVVVKQVNYDLGTLKIKPVGEDEDGFSFLTTYSSSRNVNKNNIFSNFFKEDSMNFPSGYFYTPNVGDMLLVAVVYDIVGEMNIQNPLTRVIILGFLDNEFHFSPNDEIDTVHKSGASLRINHAWLDQNIFEADQQKLIRLNGHITLVGNRVVTLSGRKFLPFGGLAHQRTNNNNLVRVQETNEPQSAKWTDMFTNDLSKIILTPDFTKIDINSSNNMFLEPPCPADGEMMEMHDSGWKHHIDTTGHETNVVMSKVTLHGTNYQQYSFDPTNALTGIDAADHTFITTTFADSAVIHL